MLERYGLDEGAWYRLRARLWDKCDQNGLDEPGAAGQAHGATKASTAENDKLHSGTKVKFCSLVHKPPHSPGFCSTISITDE